MTLAVILLLLSDVRLVSSRRTSLASLSDATSQASLSHCLSSHPTTILLKLMYILRAVDITYSGLDKTRKSWQNEDMTIAIWYNDRVAITDGVLEDIILGDYDPFWERALRLTADEFSRFCTDTIDENMYGLNWMTLWRNPDGKFTLFLDREECEVFAYKKGRSIFFFADRDYRVLLAHVVRGRFDIDVTDSGRLLFWTRLTLNEQCRKMLAMKMWMSFLHEEYQGWTYNPEVRLIELNIRSLMEEGRWESAVELAAFACSEAKLRNDDAMFQFFHAIIERIQRFWPINPELLDKMAWR